MSREIMKCTITDNDLTVRFPVGAEVLGFDHLPNGLVLWVLTDPSQTMSEERRFCIYTQGYQIPDDKAKFIDKYFVGNRAYFLFEVEPNKW